MMNLLDSHDVERVASMIVNPDIWYDHNGNPASNKDFDVRKPTGHERLKQKLISGIQFTLLGAPQIYYGDEAGMWGGDDPDCRKPMVWKGLTYETETTHPFGKPRPADEVKFDQSLFDWYKKLAHIRKENKALSMGDIEFDVIDNVNRILSYKRKLQKQAVVIIVNNNPSTNKINFSSVKFLNIKDSWIDQISDVHIQKQNGKIELAPYQILILK